MDATDAALVARVRAGDGDAFRALVDRHGRKVYRLAFRLIGTEEDAEDIVQETFLRAYRNLDSFNEQAQFSSWIYRIASNHALDLLRGRKRRAERSLSAPLQNGDGEETISDHLAAREPGPDRKAAGGEFQQRIQAVLAELSPQERVAFTLRHFEEHSIEEISAALGVSASATRNAVFRAVQKVRRALEPVRGGNLR
jgi:RNA polymerase sigma-70 factor (ECF subfamily)